MQINSYSVFDALCIGNILCEYVGDFNSSELDLFAYFSAMLFLYDKHPISNWGYKFIKNDIGAPISLEIRQAVSNLLQTQDIISTGGYYKLTSKATSKLETLKRAYRFKYRTKYIENACDSLLTLPLGAIRTSISKEPIINIEQTVVRELFEENSVALDLLYEKFRKINLISECNKSLYITALYLLKNELCGSDL